VLISLTADGREALQAAVGGTPCARGQIPGLSIGGTESAPRVVVLARKGCKATQFVLSSDWGVAVATTNAPTG
jgi:hypothetical protein